MALVPAIPSTLTLVPLSWEGAQAPPCSLCQCLCLGPRVAPLCLTQPSGPPHLAEGGFGEQHPWALEQLLPRVLESRLSFTQVCVPLHTCVAHGHVCEMTSSY